MRCKKSFFAILPLLFCLAGCRTMADYDFSSVDFNVARGKYFLAREELLVSADLIYTVNDELLFDLDIGVLSHFAGDYENSNAALSDAEILFEEYSAESISQMLASVIVNDTVKDYSGEDFEDIYANIFMALNYVHLGLVEDALVEVRRADNKIKLLRSKYEEQRKIIEDEGLSPGAKIQPFFSQFSDSALARYISLLLYRSENDLGNAEVDLKYIDSAFESQKSLYPFKKPSSLDGELSVPEGMARLNVLAFSGKAPVKEEEVFRPYWSDGILYKIALPVMVSRPSDISRIRVFAENSETHEIFSADAELLESLERICADTFRQSFSVIYAKSLARAVARGVGNSVLSALAESADEDTGLFLMMLCLGQGIATEFVERADVRTSRYFPGKASVAAFTLEPGEYDVAVQFMQGQRVVFEENKSIFVGERGLNLVESACLR